MLRAALASLALAAACHARIYPLDQNSHPYVQVLEPQLPVSWGSKTASLAMAQSHAVRVSGRGLQLLHPASSTLVFPPAGRAHRGSPASFNGWQRAPCER